MMRLLHIYGRIRHSYGENKDDGESIESVLCGHSEKLAVIFNFIKRTIRDVIQVFKNLRVCDDCCKLLDFCMISCKFLICFLNR